MGVTGETGGHRIVDKVGHVKDIAADLENSS